MMLRGKFGDRCARLDAFGNLPGRRGDFGNRASPAELLTEVPVSRQRGRAGRHEIAEPGQTGEGVGIGPQHHSEPGDLGQPSGDHRRRRIRSQAEPDRHANCQRDHVLRRSGELTADHIGVGVRAEPSGMTHRLKCLSCSWRDTRHHARRWLPFSDLASQVGAGDRHNPVGCDITGFGHHLAHPQPAA